MFDPDHQRPILRLAEPRFSKTFEHHYRMAADGTTVRDLAAELAAAEADMEASIARWSEAFTAWQAERAQSRPISAVRDGMVRF